MDRQPNNAGAKIHVDVLLTIAKTIQNISQQQHELINKLEDLRHTIITDVSRNIFEDELTHHMGRRFNISTTERDFTTNSTSQTSTTPISGSHRQNTITNRDRLEDENSRRKQFGTTTLHDARFHRNFTTMPRRAPKISLTPQFPYTVPRHRQEENQTNRDRGEI